MKRLIVSLVALSFIAACSGSKGGNDVVATINGKAVTEKDLEPIIAPQMSRLEGQIYQIKQAGLNQLIEERLIADAAAKQKVSVEEFLKTEVESKGAEPTEDEIKAFYEARKSQIGDKKFDEMKETIRSFLSQGRKRSAQEALVARLRTEADVKIKLEAPRKEVDVGKSPSKGPASAPVTIVEFSDYQCPFCGRARPTVNQILSTYGDKVRYVFKDFPLSFHKDAPKAHEAAHCANDQEKYWEYNEKLFENQQNLKVEELKKYAQELKLDVTAFNKCLDEGKYAKNVQEDLESGAKAGVSGTPAFFINGIQLSGARPFNDFKEIIDQELAKK